MFKTESEIEVQVALQRAYYAETAKRYDEMHAQGEGEHDLALGWLIAACKFFGIRSILDVGSGTGRALLKIKADLPGIGVVGIEPSIELRNIGHAKGISADDLIDGDAMKLSFADGAFDLVCEFGALHHIPAPAKAVSEMLRVAAKAVFISDSNNFGQGSPASRLTKQMLNATGLWHLADLIKTRGKGYTISLGDGLAYSFSVFDNYRLIRSQCKSVHLLNTIDAGPNLYRTASHVALLGIKHPN